MSRPPEEVNENIAYRTPEAQAMADLIAKQIKATSKRGDVNQEMLSDRIQEIEEETQIKGPDYVKVHVIDPEWTLQNSGFVDIESNGLLDEIEIEFPAGSKRFWVICRIDGSNDTTEANFIITFEDKLFARLRSEWGVKTVPPNTQTRAKFVHSLLVEANVPAVIPGIGILQPVEEEKTGELGQIVIESTTQNQNKHATANKTPGVTGGSAITIDKATPDAQQLADVNTALGVARRHKAPMAAVEALIVAGITESGFRRGASENNEPSNPHKGIWQSDIIPGDEVARQAEHFLIGGESFATGGAIVRANKGIAPAKIAVEVEIGGSEQRNKEALPEAQAIIQKGGGAAGLGGGSGSATEAKGDIGQLKRGTDSNPDEDSAECIERLAQQVDWFGFADGHCFYYMTGPELAAQRPAIYVDIPRNHVITNDGTSEYGAIVSPTTYTFDQTSFEYRLTHKVKTRTQRRSRAVKPSSPSEIKLDLICEIGQYVAGQVLVFRHSGPVSSVGRWIIVQTTRKCMKNIFTEILCEPPLEPLPEPKESSKEEVSTGEGGGGASEQAKRALSERAKYRYSEGADRGNNGTLYGPEPRTMDCSSFVTLAYKAASLPDPSNHNYEPIGDTATLIANCEKVANPTKDDLCFFGPSESATVHVTIYVGGGKAIAMQAPGITLGEGEAKTFGPGNFLGFYRPKNY